MHKEFLKINTGMITSVLFEKTRSDGMISGFTSNYIRVEHQWQSELACQVRKVRLKGTAPSGKMNIELI